MVERHRGPARLAQPAGSSARRPGPGDGRPARARAARGAGPTHADGRGDVVVVPSSGAADARRARRPGPRPRRRRARRARRARAAGAGAVRRRRGRVAHARPPRRPEAVEVGRLAARRRPLDDVEAGVGEAGGELARRRRRAGRAPTSMRARRTAPCGGPTTKPRWNDSPASAPRRRVGSSSSAASPSPGPRTTREVGVHAERPCSAVVQGRVEGRTATRAPAPAGPRRPRGAELGAHAHGRADVARAAPAGERVDAACSGAGSTRRSGCRAVRGPRRSCRSSWLVDRSPVRCCARHSPRSQRDVPVLLRRQAWRAWCAAPQRARTICTRVWDGAMTAST